MRKIAKLFVVAAVLAVICFTASAKKLEIMKIAKGEMPNDSNGCDVTCAEEHAEKKGGVSLKVVASADGGYFFGQLPAKGIWDGYDVIKIGLFNAGKAPMKGMVIIKPKGSTYESRMDYSFMAKPGDSEIEVDIAGATTNSGKAMSFKEQMGQFDICPDGVKKGDVIFVKYIRLQTTDEDEKEEKTKK